jgi:hypothetical protein
MLSDEHQPTKRRWTTVIFDRLSELVIVFIGVYAAFVLSAHQSHEHERQRRGQILALLEKGAAATSANLKQTTVAYDQRMNEFLTQLAKGEMPGISAISWANSYNPEERNWLLQAGLELLDIETIVRLKELDAVARTGFATMAHYQQISDQLIVPHVGEGPAFFYDPGTKQLRSEYAQYPEMLREGSRFLHELSEKTDRLVSQLRAEQDRHH